MSDNSKGSAGAVVGGAIAAAVLSLGVLGMSLFAGNGSTDMSPPTSATATVCGGIGGAALPPTVVPASITSVGVWRGESLSIASRIMAIGVQRNVGMQGQLVALMAGMQESGLRNILFGDRDSLGIFQMRPSMGWGTREQLTNIDYAINKFYDVLLKQPKGWETQAPGRVAQAIERSGFPFEYDKHEPGARELIAKLSVSATTPAQPQTTCAGGGDAAASQATTLDQLPQFPMPAGCVEQPVVWSPIQGPSTINGNIPADHLCPIPGTRFTGQPRAVAAYVAMAAAYQAETGHQFPRINDGYRSYSQQVFMKASRGGFAAPPGFSNHGFGIAIDVNVATSKEAELWMHRNGPRFGWWHPLWARPGGSPVEAWHMEYGTWLLEARYKTMSKTLISH